MRLVTSWATQPLTSFSCRSFRHWFTWPRWACSHRMDWFSVHFWWFSISLYRLVERALNLGGKVVCSILISKFKPKAKIYWKVCSFFGWGSMCPASTYGVMGGWGSTCCVPAPSLCSAHLLTTPICTAPNASPHSGRSTRTQKGLCHPRRLPLGAQGAVSVCGKITSTSHLAWCYSMVEVSTLFP